MAVQDDTTQRLFREAARGATAPQQVVRVPVARTPRVVWSPGTRSYEGWTGRVNGRVLFGANYGVQRGDGWVLTTSLPWYRDSKGHEKAEDAMRYAETILADFVNKIGAKFDGQD